MQTQSKKRVMVSWSTGKDSAWTLAVLRRDPTCEVVGLVTSVVPKWGRVSMHGVRETLALAQAKAAGLLWYNVYLDWPCSNAQYEAHTKDALRWLKIERQVDAIAYGDLYLADVRAYRERLMADTGLELLFPLWGRDTRALASEMITAGLRARVVCLDPQRLPRHLAGAEFDREFLEALPPGVDPCAEAGEFHTFCYAGPMFASAVPIRAGQTVEREGFLYTDLDLEPPVSTTAPTTTSSYGAQRPKICPRCQQPFACHTGNCWCEGVEIDPALRTRLREQFHDCLCAECLRQLVAEHGCVGMAL